MRLLTALPFLLQASPTAGPASPDGPAAAPPDCAAPDRAVVDRLEGERAVLVAAGGRVTRVLPRSLLPEGLAEGDVLVGGRVRADCREALTRQVAAARPPPARRAPPATGALTAAGEN